MDEQASTEAIGKATATDQPPLTPDLKQIRAEISSRELTNAEGYGALLPALFETFVLGHFFGQFTSLASCLASVALLALGLTLLYAAHIAVIQEIEARTARRKRLSKNSPSKPPTARTAADPPLANIEKPVASRAFASGRVNVSVEELPSILYSRLCTLCDNLVPMLKLAANGEMDTEDRHAVTQINEKWLPEVIGNYLALPDEAARQAKLPDGRTAEMATVQQMDVLHGALREIRARHLGQQLDNICAQERFLKQRFPLH